MGASDDGLDPSGALAAMGDDSRTVTSHHAHADRWTLFRPPRSPFGSRHASQPPVRLPCCAGPGEQTLRASVSQLMLAQEPKSSEPTAMAGFCCRRSERSRRSGTSSSRRNGTRHVQAASTIRSRRMFATAQCSGSRSMTDRRCTGVYFDWPRANLSLPSHRERGRDVEVRMVGLSASGGRWLRVRLSGRVPRWPGRTDAVGPGDHGRALGPVGSAATRSAFTTDDHQARPRSRRPRSAYALAAQYRVYLPPTLPHATRRSDARFDVQVSLGGCRS